MIKKIVLLIIILSCISCMSKNTIDKNKIKEAKLVTYHDFFKHMTENIRPEKIRNKNYYIFHEDNDFVYYSKVKQGFTKEEILEPIKVNKGQLIQKFPNYKKLTGPKLYQIIKSDFLKTNDSLRGKINIVTSTFKLNENIDAKLFYKILGDQEIKEVFYILDCKDFSILKQN